MSDARSESPPEPAPGRPDIPGLELDLVGGALWITMTRAESRNSITTDSVAGLLDAVRWAGANNARVLVLQGDARAWSVGGDLGAFHRAENPARYVDDVAEALHRLISELTHADAIVVAAVDGVAAGAGMPLAAAADIILASTRARFTLGYTKIGLTPDGGSTLLTSTLGLHRTLALALLNPVLSAQEAMDCGLVTQVSEPAELRGAVESVVATLVSGSAGALATAKHLIRARASADAEAGMRAESLAIRRAVAGSDAAEGIAAFLEKRRPAFG